MACSVVMLGIGNATGVLVTIKCLRNRYWICQQGMDSGNTVDSINLSDNVAYRSVKKTAAV